MDVSTITAVSAIVIALASLAVSVLEARAARQHNRVSVTPILQIYRVRKYGDLRVGLQLRNVGLGPAVIVSTEVTLDESVIGKWDRDSLTLIVGPNKPTPKFSALYDGSVVPAGDDRFLISINSFKEEPHAWFWELIASRLTVVICYESVYGGEHFKASKHPR